MERRIEPEPALGRERRRHLDVGDQELVLEHLSGELRPTLAQRRRRRRRRPRSGRSSAYGPSGVSTSEHMVVARFERRPLVAPAQVGPARRAAVDQIGLGIELLQVDEGRPLVALLGQQVELVELRSSRKILPTLQTTPPSTMRWPMPSRSQNSSERLEKQIARDRRPRRLSSSSTTFDAMLREVDRDASPTGPAPTIATCARATPPAASSGGFT